MKRLVWLVLVFSFAASAKTFQNSYIRLELPESWKCTQEGTAWVCAPKNASDAREAVIVATAKLAGPEDNLNAFANFLRQPKTLIAKSQSTMSQPISIEHRTTAGLDWIQAVHLGSEAPNFMTRYMATVKERLAVLVSFSAERDNARKYDPIFDTAIKTLQIDSSKPLLIQPQTADRSGVIGQGAPAQDPSSAATQTAAPKNRRMLIFSLIGVGVLIALLVLRRLV